MMGHVLSTVSQRLSGAISCVRIDVDKYPALASKYQVQVRTAIWLTHASQFAMRAGAERVESLDAVQL